MTSRRRHPRATTQSHDRAYLLGERKRNDVLALSEVERYGCDSFGDPDYVSIYGLKPEDWYARGVRLLGRTVVECTRDRLADLIGRDVAALTGADSEAAGSVVVDPFAGSGNTLYWVRRHVSALRGVGFELDDAVFEASRRNLSIVGLDLELLHRGYEAGLRALSIPDDELLVVFVAPPWGDALDPASGLDLHRTAPPVTEILDRVANTFPRHRILLAIQIYENVVAGSLVSITSRCDWSARTTYDIDPPGKNHGLLLCTVGWTPECGGCGEPSAPRS